MRAVQTGEIVCEALDIDPKDLHATEALKSEAKPQRLAEELSKIKAGEVICFGHAPQMDEFIAYAVRARSAVHLAAESRRGLPGDREFFRAAGVLVWLLTAKALRRLGK